MACLLPAAGLEHEALDSPTQGLEAAKQAPASRPANTPPVLGPEAASGHVSLGLWPQFQPQDPGARASGPFLPMQGRVEPLLLWPW